MWCDDSKGTYGAHRDDRRYRAEIGAPRRHTGPGRPNDEGARRRRGAGPSLIPATLVVLKAFGLAAVVALASHGFRRSRLSAASPAS
jgi:hypothetical protein